MGSEMCIRDRKDALEQILNGLEETLRKEYSVADPNVTLQVEISGEKDAEILSYTSMTKVIFYLRNVPNGVQNMSQVMPGLVETSLNLGIMELIKEGAQGELCLTASVRSSVSSRKADLASRLTMLAEFLGGEMTISGDYPAWEYRADSDIRETVSSVYKDLFGEEPVFEAIHAGLECGILSGKIENLDCVSFGPNNFDIHTPKERLSISSTEKIWKLLVEFLKNCK